MSVLTKLFVVLLVIVSLLLTAATVTFVNRAEPWKKLAEENSSAAKRKDAEISTLKVELVASQAQVQQASASGTAAASELRATINQLNGSITDLKNQVNVAVAEKQQLQATLNVSNEAVAGAQKNIADIDSRYKEAVKKADELISKNTEVTGANTDMIKRLDEAERERRFLIETVNQIKVDLDKARALLVEYKVPVNPQAKRRSAPDIKGVVREVKIQDGMAFATISVGVADKVEKGMKFTVIDPAAGDFLGYLFVDTVDQNMSFGRLEGPRIQEVKPNSEVRTQLSSF